MTRKLFIACSSLLCVLAIASTALAQRGGRIVPSSLRDGTAVKSAFKEVVAPASKSTVRVICGGRDCALGTIVASDGWIVTKYSELRDKIICRTSEGKSYQAIVVGYEPKFDLALLKIDATGLKPADWASETGPDVGQLVATTSIGEIPHAIGVISTPRRAIPRRSGLLGVMLDDADGGPRIVAIEANSAAERAGLKLGDIVAEIDDTVVRTKEKMIATIKEYQPNESVNLRVKRASEDLQLTAKLKDRDPNGRAIRMNAMGSLLSNRATDFPSVIQHDSVIRAVDCGGPLVDLSGKVIGVNIARAGRTESYAIPADRIVSMLPDLQSGKFAPKRPLPGAVVAKQTQEVKSAEEKPDQQKPRDTSAE